MKLYISTGNSRMEKKWNGQEMEFSVFLERLSHTAPKQGIPDYSCKEGESL